MKFLSVPPASSERIGQPIWMLIAVVPWATHKRVSHNLESLPNHISGF